MKTTAAEILDVVARYEHGLMRERELSDWSAGLVQKGAETKSLILLAGMTPSDYGDARSLLRGVMSETGLPFPSDRLVSLAYAKIIAQQIVTGKIDPHEGCAKIDVVNSQLDFPDELSPFGLLAHEQTGHDHIGITSSDVLPNILAASEELLKLELEY